jgi:hypothetical protein
MVASPPRLWPLTDCTANCRPVLSSERAPKEKRKAIFREKKGKSKIWSWAPKGCPTPRHTDWLTVSRKVTLTLTLIYCEMLVVVFSTVVLGSYSHGTCDDVLLSDGIWRFSESELQPSVRLDAKPLEAHDQSFIHLQLFPCRHDRYVTPSVMRGWVSACEYAS